MFVINNKSGQNIKKNAYVNSLSIKNASPKLLRALNYYMILTLGININILRNIILYYIDIVGF